MVEDEKSSSINDIVLEALEINKQTLEKLLDLEKRMDNLQTRILQLLNTQEIILKETGVDKIIKGEN